MIHVLGNSHVRYFLGRPPSEPGETETTTVDGIDLTVAQLGSTGATAYGLRNKNSKTGARVAIQEYMERDDVRGYYPEALVLVFGEVDVREHLAKHVHERTVEQQLRDIVENYLDFIESFRTLFQRIVLFGAINYSREFYESRPERNVILHGSIALDRILREAQVWDPKYEIHHLSVLDETRDDLGYLRQEYWHNPDGTSPGEIHLNCKNTQALVMAKLKGIIGQ